MGNLPKLTDLEVTEKKVLLRADVDLGKEIKDEDRSKLETLLPTINYLLEKNAKIVMIGHRGRPDVDYRLRSTDYSQEVLSKFSLKPVAELLSEMLSKEVKFIESIMPDEASSTIQQYNNIAIFLLENLRFDKREEENDEGFAKELAELGELYVNEAFSASHREHTSIVALPRLLKQKAENNKQKATTAFGTHFIKEVDNLNKVREDPKRPVVVILGGAKEDKLDRLDDLKGFADKVLVGGRLPMNFEDSIYQDSSVDPKKRILNQVQDDKVVVANLIPDREDITLHSIEVFEDIIAGAGTVFVSGPMGVFEEDGHRQGTKRVLEAIVNSSAFKVAGGGDTQQAIEVCGLSAKFDWISVGGGASLEFVARGTLPGIEAVAES